MFTYEQYIGRWYLSPDLTYERVANIQNKLMPAVESLYARLVSEDIEFRTNPTTNSQISGQLYGGFRPQSCTQGAPNSSHKEGLAVDLYDPNGEIDAYLLKNPDVLEEHGIYIEHPDKTPNWSHWSVKPPASGRHVFYP
jgi:hypothetical protein